MAKLTKQEKKFVEIKAETGNGAFAAKEAFAIEDPNYAAVKASRLLRKDNIIQAIQDALPDDLLSERHLELLNKRDNYTYHTSFKDENGKEQVEVHKIDLGPEVQAVTKGLDMAYKIKGSYAAEKHVNLNLDANSTERTRDLGNRLIGLFRRGN